MKKDGIRRATIGSSDRNLVRSCNGETSNGTRLRRMPDIRGMGSLQTNANNNLRGNLAASGSSASRQGADMKTHRPPRPIVGWRPCLCFPCKLLKLRRKTSAVEVQNCGDTLMERRLSSGSRTKTVSNFQTIAMLKEGDIFAHKYKIKSGCIQRKPHIRYAKNIYSKQRVVLKFYSSHTRFENCKYMHRHLESRHICRLVDILEVDGQHPPCLVFERGDYTLKEWMLMRGHYPTSQKDVLFQILEALAYLHDEQIVHGDLKPSNIVYFAAEHSWKLLDLDTAARMNELMPVSCTPPYAPPEIARVLDQTRAGTMRLNTTADMWSFGVIAFEVLTGKPFYGTEAMTDDATGCLFWRQAFPSLECIEERAARKLVRKLLQMDPEKRTAAREALTNATFKASEDSSQTAARWLAMEATQSRILQAVGSVREEISLANVTAALSLEEFMDDALNRPLHERECKEVVTMTDSDRPDEPIFLLNLEKDYRIRVSLVHQHGSCVPFKKVTWIAVKAPGSQACALNTEYVIKDGSIEIVALLEPAKCNSEKLLAKSPKWGTWKQKYVCLDVFIGLAIDSDNDEIVEMKETVYCRMHDADDHFRTQRSLRYLKHKWIQSPQWLKSSVASAEALLNVAGATATIFE